MFSFIHIAPLSRCPTQKTCTTSPFHTAPTFFTASNHTFCTHTSIQLSPQPTTPIHLVVVVHLSNHFRQAFHYHQHLHHQNALDSDLIKYVFALRLTFSHAHSTNETSYKNLEPFIRRKRIISHRFLKSRVHITITTNKRRVHGRTHE